MQTLFTIKEVAAIARLHENTVRAAIRAGELGHCRLRRNIRVSRLALEHWLGTTLDDAQTPST